MWNLLSQSCATEKRRSPRVQVPAGVWIAIFTSMALPANFQKAYAQFLEVGVNLDRVREVLKDIFEALSASGRLADLYLAYHDEAIWEANRLQDESRPKIRSFGRLGALHSALFSGNSKLSAAITNLRGGFCVASEDDHVSIGDMRVRFEGREKELLVHDVDKALKTVLKEVAVWPCTQDAAPPEDVAGIQSLMVRFCCHFFQ